MSFFPPAFEISADGVNSRAAATLAAGATFQGEGEDVSKYGRVGVSITTSNATDGTLTMEVSHDGTTWGGPERTWEDTRFAQPHMWNIVEQYFRIKYVNGTTEADDLSIQVQYTTNADILLGHQLDEALSDEIEAIVVRAVGVGQDPNGVYTNARISGVDNANSSVVNLTAATSLVFTGEWSLISGYIGITVLVDGTSSGVVSGVLQLQFSHDGITINRNITPENASVASVNPRTLGVVAKYFRVIYTSDSDLLTFDIQTMFHTQQVQLVSRLDQTLEGTEDVTNVRSISAGRQPGGAYSNTLLNEESQSLFAIGRPLTSSGEMSVALSHPQIQIEATKGLRDNIETFVDDSGTGSVATVDNNFVCQTGTGIGAFGVIRSMAGVKYRPGQGLVFRYSAIFDSTNAVANSIQVAGPFNSGSALFVGYNGVDFGVLHRKDGKHEIRTLTITTDASGSEDVSLTLDGVLYTIPVTSGGEAHNAFEIAAWMTDPVNQTLWQAS